LAELTSDEELLSELKLSQYGGKLLGKIAFFKLQPNNFYTSRTSKAFHNLLCNLIRRFLIALEDLQNTQSMTRKKSCPTGIIMQKVDAVVELGTILRMMVRGAAMKNHF
jgi:hypothetical protein